MIVQAQARAGCVVWAQACPRGVSQGRCCYGVSTAHAVCQFRGSDGRKRQASYKVTVGAPSAGTEARYQKLYKSLLQSSSRAMVRTAVVEVVAHRNKMVSSPPRRQKIPVWGDLSPEEKSREDLAAVFCRAESREGRTTLAAL
eukprot:1039076-Rhodomonas_salina.1